MSTGNLQLGISIVAIGVIMFLQSTGRLSHEVIQYWPVLIIALGLVSWTTNGKRPSTGTVLVLVVGGIFLAGQLMNATFSQAIWPSIVIITGINLAIGGSKRQNSDP